MTVPANIICAWPGTNASVPGGWTRATGLDGRYPKHLATISANPGTTGGSATHTHASAAHSHTITHNHTATSSNEDADLASGTVVLQGAGAYDTPQSPHHHAITLATVSASSGSATLTWDATPNDPPYYAVIWIQSDGTPTGIPPSALALWNTQTVPANWIQHVASKGRYLRGAAAGADGGVTGGDTHNHTSLTTHSHTGGSHTHGGTSSAWNGSAWSNVVAGGVQLATASHVHAVSDAAGTTGALNAVSSAATGATAIGVPYVNLTAIQNSQTSTQQPVGIICLWLGTLASIPGGWNQVTTLPTGRFLKATNTLTTVNQTGGAQGHAHGSPFHSHTQSLAGHSHQVGLAGNTAYNLAGLTSGSVTPPAVASHGHVSPAATSTTDASVSDSALASVAAIADDRPLFTEVAFVQFGGPMTVAISSPTGGAVLSTSTPAVAWTLTAGYTQNDYRLFVYAADGVTVVYDSGRQTSAATSATVPSGYLQTGQTYLLQVVVDDTQGDNAVSAPVTVTTSWSTVPSIASITTAPVGGT